VLYLGLNLVMIALFSPWQGLENSGWVLNSTMIGLTGGLALGLIEARAIERAVVAEREATRTEQIEQQRDWFEYLNGLLRHEVLNSAHLINGYVDLLREEVDQDDPRRGYLERIGRRSHKMTEVIQDVRVLLRATNDRDEFEPVDVVDLLSAEVSALLDEHDGIYVDTSWPERAHVPGDDLLARVFSNLLANAVEHNDSPEPSIGVSVETTADAVTVTIADNGPGIPPDQREVRFERTDGDDHGLGPSLVDRLVERFGGSIDLVATGPDVSVLAVELPRATPGEGDAVAAEPARAVVDAS
jgi:signal transduction histidine kinase